MSSAYQLRSMQLQLAQERLARLLVERGVPSVTADAIVSTGTFQGVGHGAVVVADFGDTRAVTNDPDSFAALADVLAAADPTERHDGGPLGVKDVPRPAHESAVHAFL